MSRLEVLYWTPEEEFISKEEIGEFKQLMARAHELKMLPETYAVRVTGDDDEVYVDWVNWQLYQEIEN